MPGKRGRPKKKHDEVDKNLSGEEEDGLVSRRASNRRPKKIISYSEESPNVTKKAKLSRNNVLKDANDNEIIETHSKIPKKEKISKRPEKTNLTDKKAVKIKTEEKEVAVKTKVLVRKKKKKENKISDEKQILDDEGDRNTTAGGTVDNSTEWSNEEQTFPGRTELHNPSLDSTPNVTVDLEATFTVERPSTVETPSTQEDACLSRKDTQPTNVSWEDSLENNVTRKQISYISPTRKDTQGTDVTRKDRQDIDVTCKDTQDTDVIDKADTRDANVTNKDTQDTDVADKDTQDTDVTDKDTQDIDVTRKDTQDADVTEKDTQDANVTDIDTRDIAPEDTQNRRDTQRDKHDTEVPRLENVDTLAEKIALQLASQQNDCLRPFLEKMDDLMKTMSDLSQENQELKRTCGNVQTNCLRKSNEHKATEYNETTSPSGEFSDSAVQTLPSPQVHVQTQTIEKYQIDTTRDVLTSVQNERDIWWAKYQSQTKVIRDLQNDLYTTRNDFSKDKVTYQATLVSVLTTLSDYTRVYNNVVARLSRENLSLDELCTLISEVSARHPGDDCNRTEKRRISDDLILTGPGHDSDIISEPADHELTEVKLEPQSPPGN